MAGIERTNEVLHIQNEAKKNGESLTLWQIGERMNPPITAERVRQIIYEDAFRNNYCNIHECKYEQQCHFCEIVVNYEKLLKTLSTKQDFEFEFRRLSTCRKTKDIILQKTMLIQKAKKRFGYSNVVIGEMLKRHHTTIAHLKKKEIKVPNEI